MTRNIGLWIDHKRAVLVTLSEQGENLQLLESGVGKHPRYHGATHPKSTYSAQYQQGDDQLDRQFMERLNKFYNALIAHIRGADALFIFGPGEAKLELEKRLNHGKVQVRIAGIEAADKMTDRQIAARVRGYFPRLAA